MDPDSGMATDNLPPQVTKMFEELGTNCTTVSQVITSKDKAVFKAIQDGIDRYNTQYSISDWYKVNNRYTTSLEGIVVVCVDKSMDVAQY